MENNTKCNSDINSLQQEVIGGKIEEAEISYLADAIMLLPVEKRIKFIAKMKERFSANAE